MKNNVFKFRNRLFKTGFDRMDHLIYTLQTCTDEFCPVSYLTDKWKDQRGKKCWELTLKQDALRILTWFWSNMVSKRVSKVDWSAKKLQNGAERRQNKKIYFQYVLKLFD